MEKQLKCVLLLSLKEMALRRVAVVLWSGSDILASISKFRSYDHYYEDIKKDWIESIEGKVKEKMLKLVLPESLTKEIIDIVRPIGLQIKRWKECQEYHLSDEYEKIGLAKLCWTAAGSIDNRKTVEELVRCDSIDVVRRYRLACTNCVEDYIPLLWEKLPQEKKDYFYNTVLHIKPTSPCLHFCWPFILNGELSKLDYLWRTEDRNVTSFNQWAFVHSAEAGVKTAAEYFFQKLTHEEREASLVRTALVVLANRLYTQSRYIFRNGLSDLLCYLLSFMTPEQQMEIFKAWPIDVLWCFLDWPWQDLFLENASLIWTFLSPSSYGDLLRKMAYIVRHSDHNFKRWFPEFFMQSPLDFRKCFVDEDSETGETPACHFLSAFHEYEDSEYIKVIFRNLDAADRVKLLFNRRVFVLVLNCMSSNRWHMVEVYIREATLSKEDRERLREAFTGFLKSFKRVHLVSRNLDLERFFELLDVTDASADKEKKGQKRKLENCCTE